MKKILLIIYLVFLVGCTLGGQYKIQSSKKSHSFQSSDIARHPGGKSQRFELHYNDYWAYNSAIGNFKSPRTEIRQLYEARSSDVWWYGLSIMIPKESDDPPIGRPVIITQWHTTYFGKRGMGPIAKNVFVDGKVLFYYSDADPHVVIEDLEKGEWLDLIYQLKFGHYGFVNLWVNGKKILSYEDWMSRKGLHPYVKYGLYAPLGISPEMKYIIYVDNYKRGKSYEEVDPSIE